MKFGLNKTAQDFVILSCHTERSLHCHTERSEVSIQKTENGLLNIEFMDFSLVSLTQNDKAIVILTCLIILINFIILSAAKYP